MFVRTVLVWHITWSVNSVTHLWGYRNYETDEAAAISPSEIHCIELAYPEGEKRAFDGIVTRISLSLRPRSRHR